MKSDNIAHASLHPTPLPPEARVAEDYGIRYHVGNSDAFLKFLFFAKERFGLPFGIRATCRNGSGLMVVLRKSAP